MDQKHKHSLELKLELKYDLSIYLSLWCNGYNNRNVYVISTLESRDHGLGLYTSRLLARE